MQNQTNHVVELAENPVSAVHAQATHKVEASKGYALKNQQKLAQADKESNV